MYLFVRREAACLAHALEHPLSQGLGVPFAAARERDVATQILESQPSGIAAAIGIRQTGCVAAARYACFVPARTNPRQRVVALVKEHYAGPDDVVTESKFLMDKATGDQREVDIVIESNVAGDEVVISVEVIAHERRASVTWAEQTIKKHEHLPTNLLILVSWSGFSPRALRKIASEGGHVVAVTPEQVVDDGVPRRMPQLWADQMELMPEGYRMSLRMPDGTVRFPDPSPDFESAVYDANGVEVGTVALFVSKFLGSERLMRECGALAHAAENRDELNAFVVGVETLGNHNLYVHRTSDDGGEESAFLRIETLECRGQFKFIQTEIDMNVMHLRGKAFAAGEAPLFGTPTVWVATPHEDDPEHTARISFRPIGP